MRSTGGPLSTPQKPGRDAPHDYEVLRGGQKTRSIPSASATSIRRIAANSRSTDLPQFLEKALGPHTDEGPHRQRGPVIQLNGRKATISWQPARDARLLHRAAGARRS